GQAVAQTKTEATQGGRGTLDLTKQLPIAERPPAAALVECDQSGLIAATGRHMPIEGVVSEVCVATRKPPERRRLRLLEHPIGRRGPVDQLSGLAPERVRVLQRAPVEGVVAAAQIDSRIVDHGWPPVREGNESS